MPRKSATKFPNGTWVRAAAIYIEKYMEGEKQSADKITPNLIRSRFYNTFNPNVVKAVEEATRQLSEEMSAVVAKKNELMGQYARNN